MYCCVSIGVCVCIVYIAHPCSGTVLTISVLSYAALAAGLMLEGHITVLCGMQGVVSFQCGISGWSAVS